MARVKKIPPSLDALFFATPEQRVMRFLISEPTTSFTPRVLGSKLKSVRGLGGAEGLARVLSELQTLGLVDFVDNHRSVRVQDDNPVVQLLKTFAAVCDLEDLKVQLEPVSTKGILYGARARGTGSAESEYELFVVSETPEEVKRITHRHPMGKRVLLTAETPEVYGDIAQDDPGLAQKLGGGIVIWGGVW